MRSSKTGKDCNQRQRGFRHSIIQLRQGAREREHSEEWDRHRTIHIDESWERLPGVGWVSR